MAECVGYEAIYFMIIIIEIITVFHNEAFSLPVDAVVIREWNNICVLIALLVVIE